MSYSISGLPDYWFGLPTVSNPPPPLEPVPSYINWANWSLGGIPHPTYGNFCGQPVGWVERSDTHHVVAPPCWRARLSSQLHCRAGASSSNGCGTFSKVMGFASAQPILRSTAGLLLRAGKRDLAFGAEDIAIKARNPLASARRHVEITYFSLNMRRHAVPIKLRVAIDDVGG